MEYLHKEVPLSLEEGLKCSPFISFIHLTTRESPQMGTFKDSKFVLEFSVCVCGGGGDIPP